MAWSVPTSAFLAKTVDGQHRLFYSNGAVRYITHSNYGGRAAWCFIILALACAGLAIADHLRAPLIKPDQGRLATSARLLLIMFGWWVATTAVHSGVSARDRLGAVAGFMLASGIALAPPHLVLLKRLGWLLAAVIVSNLLFLAMAPNLAAVPCRSYGSVKCGIFDSLVSGYFPQENVLGLFVAALLPVARAQANRLFAALLIIGSLTLILASGSRTALAAAAVGVIGTVFVRPGHSGRSWVSTTFAWCPFLALGVSLAVFLTAGASDFTGRGAIYYALRSELTGPWLFLGAGPKALSNAFENGYLGSFDPSQEHGYAPHLLAQFGLIGLICTVAVTLALARSVMRHGAVHPSANIFWATVSATFVTEVMWRLDLRSPTFWSLLLFVGLVAVREPQLHH